jgi:hypothetical protein
MLLATFTFGDAFLTTLEFAFLFLWIWIAVGVIFDVFRSHDLSNLAKAAWMLLIVILPFVGVLAYLLIRGHTMHEHQTEDAQARHQLFRQFMTSSAAAGPADDLAKLAELHDRGVLNDDEFERAKAKVLA